MKGNAHSSERLDELKNRYCEKGLEQLTDKEILELLLRLSDRRIDAALLSERLMSGFCNLRSVFEAPYVVLKDMGLSDKEAALLMMFPKLYERYQLSIVEQKYRGKALETDNDVAEYISPRLMYKRCEFVVLLLLSKQRRVLYCGVVDEGTVNASDVNIRRILELCVSCNAKYAVLAHNHPSGIALPSEVDITVTKRLIETCSLIGVKLLDHIIFSDTDRTFLSKYEETKALFVDA